MATSSLQKTGDLHAAQILPNISRMPTRPVPLDTKWTFTGKLKEKFSQAFYYHGLNCFRHPYLLLIIFAVLFAFATYPMVGVHLFRNDYSQQFVTDYGDFVTLKKLHQQLDISNSSDIDEIFERQQEFDFRKQLKNPPQWFLFRDPFAYVMQIVVKSSVSPWKDNLILMDAIRAPVAQVFSLVEAISNYQLQNGDVNPISLNDVCLQVSEPVLIKDKVAASYLPRYSCLLLSPANVWKNDINTFLQDSEIIKTIFGIKDTSSLESGSLKELLFGLPWMQTGIRQLYVRTRSRTITFAVTLIFKNFNEQYIEGLKAFLKEKYPENPFKNVQNDSQDVLKNFELNNMNSNKKIIHLFFQMSVNCYDYLPLLLCYFLPTLYMYYFTRKLDIIRKKWLHAVASLSTVLVSLFMSIGICFWFDFNPTINGSDILPYLVMIIGMENMMVFTKSVVSTPKNLDLKIRMAQGLSKEAWPILTTLFSAIVLYTIGFLTFLPIIQDICLFAIVGFVTDLFVQLMVFAPLLATNLRKVSIKSSHRRQQSTSKTISYAFKNDQRVNGDASLDAYKNGSIGVTKIFARPSLPVPSKTPKRLRIVYFWTSKRIAHKCVMLSFVVWFVILLSKTAIFDQLSAKDKLFEFANTHKLNLKDTQIRKAFQEFRKNSLTSDLNENYRYRHNKFTFSNFLSTQHWSTLFWNYNISLSGKYITILPSLHLSVPVDPAKALQTRHPLESDPQIFRQYLFSGSQSLPLDTNEDYFDDEYINIEEQRFGFRFPLPMITMIGLCTLVVVGIVYLFTMLYKCICSRSYADWRTSWGERKLNGGYGSAQDLEHMVMDALPWVFKAHSEEIEFICTNSSDPIVATCDFRGDLRVWDILSSECHTFINRNYLNSSLPEIAEPEAPSLQLSSRSDISSSSGSVMINRVSRRQDGFNFVPYFERFNSSKSLMKELIKKAKSAPPKKEFEDVPHANVTIRSNLKPQFLWCIRFHEKFLLVGCSNGRIEVWHALLGELCYVNQDSNVGVTAICGNGSRIFAVRLDGSIDVFEQELKSSVEEDPALFGYEKVMKKSELRHNASYTSNFGQSVDFALNKSNFLSANYQSANHITYRLAQTILAHKQPITCIKVTNTHLITGSSDHLIKIYVFENMIANCQFTLHGHLGAITCLEFDPSSNYALSGCQLGGVSIWDLATGACVFSLETNQSAITCLLVTQFYVISASADYRIYVWDKYSGHLITNIQEHHSLCQQMTVMATNILVTAKEDELHLWDVSEGKLLKIIKLTSDKKYAYIRNLSLCLKDKVIVCDYGTNLCLVHFLGPMQKHE